MGVVTVKFTVMSDEAVPAPVDDVTIRIFDDIGTYVTEGVTGSVPGSGELELSLTGEVGGLAYSAWPHKDGYSFVPSGQYDVTVYDPPGAAPNDNDFQLTAHPGMTGIMATFIVKDDQAVPQPVEDVQIRVFDEADLFVTESLTDASGELQTVLTGDVSPGLEYIVRLHKTGLDIPAGPTQRIKVIDPLGVTETNIFDFTTHTSLVPESSDPDFCMVSGYFIDARGNPLRALNLKFTPKEGYPTATISGMPFTSFPTIVRDRIIASEALVQTDNSGYAECILPRGGVFDFTIHGLETPGPEPLSEVTVPDAPGIEIHDLLFPYAKSVEYGAAGAAVVTGGTVELTVTALSSGMVPIEGQVDLGIFFLFTTGDENVATVEITEDGTLLVRGVAGGSTTVEVERVPGTYAPRRPEVPDLEKDPDPFNVTVT